MFDSSHFIGASIIEKYMLKHIKKVGMSLIDDLMGGKEAAEDYRGRRLSPVDEHSFVILDDDEDAI